MSSVKIELDLAVVQEAIHAKVQPAVDEILAGVDIPAKITAALLKKPEKEYTRYNDSFAMRVFGYGYHSRPAIEGLLDDAIQEAAKIFVENAVERERLKLETAFAKMLRSSESKLARTMVAALSDGLKNDWKFSINTQIEARDPPREIEYSD